MELDIKSISMSLNVPDTALGAMGYDELTTAYDDIEVLISISNRLKRRVKEYRALKATNLRVGMYLFFDAQILYEVVRVDFARASGVDKDKLFFHLDEVRLGKNGEVERPHKMVVAAGKMGYYKKLTKEEGLSLLRQNVKDWNDVKDKMNGQKKR
jgi:hypothetical protein